jgi:hypothetical protein
MLDVRDYDLALLERIKSFYSNTYFIMRPTIPLKEIRDYKILNGCDVHFPLITVRRTTCPIFSTEYNSWARANSGQTYLTGNSRTEKNNLFNVDYELAKSIVDSGHKDAVSVVNSTFNLVYFIDVLSLERDNFDTILIELQENLFRVPYIQFENIKSDGCTDKLIPGQACHLIVEEVEDTSDLENFDSGNALYRATITVKINAYIYRKFKTITVESFNNNTGIDEYGTYVQIIRFDPNDPRTWPPGFDPNDSSTWPKPFDINDPSTWLPGLDLNNPNTWPPGFDPNDPSTWPKPFDINDPSTYWYTIIIINDPSTWPSLFDPDDTTTWPPGFSMPESLNGVNITYIINNHHILRDN